MKKVWIGLVILAIALLLIVFAVSQKQREPEKIRIGIIAPLSGDSAKYGADIKRGYDLAVKEINQDGGIKGRKIELIYEDDEGKPEKAVAAAQKLIQHDKVIAILGPLWSSPTLAVAPIAEKNKVVLLSSGASSPKITNAGDYIFRNEISDAYGAAETATLFFKTGFKKIAILYINNDFGIGFRDVVKQIYQELGGEVTATEAFEQDEKDFRTQLLKIKESNPGAVLIVSYKEAILILRQMRELEIKKQVLSTALFEDPEIIEKVGDLSEGVLYTYYGTFDPKRGDVKVQEFMNNFKEKYGVNPEYYAPIGYDAVKILAHAIEKGGFTSEQIKNALYQVKDFPGLSGTTSFDENGDVIKPVILKTVRKGQFIRYEEK
jgi:branched-chain amino acid transport system substrate-binding protein